MPDSEGAHIARLEERVAGVREDLAGIVEEAKRTRTRLHNLEGFTQAYLDAQKMNREAERKQYRQLMTRLQILAVVVAVAGIVVPVVVVLVVPH